MGATTLATALAPASLRRRERLDHVELSDPRESLEGTELPTSPSTHPSKLAIKQKRDSESPLIRDDLTLSASASVASQSRQRSLSPSRHKIMLANATPRLRYLHKTDDSNDDAAKGLRDFLVESIAGIGDSPLESWGVQSESIVTEYQPQYTVWDRCSLKIDYVVGFPKEQWENLYDKVATRFPSGYVNHVDHPHRETQILGMGCVVKPCDGNRIEAEIQLGVWMTGYLSGAFEHRTGQGLPPRLVGCISVGDYWDYYIIYGVQDEAGDEPSVVH
ncbi:hypothetical protein BDV29DRAFT_195839 [Aspergillus leporis]|uniref:PD-(D/E)XK nuclease-like domain-containing protein n=1 Tax=Aspergillus leporis TaxID=41062 RepID=A0A5N5WI74_9EURO|nr:hypothetical protein BDV29DRAFT_195839 [Aspergillus leporis]